MVSKVSSGPKQLFFCSISRHFPVVFFFDLWQFGLNLFPPAIARCGVIATRIVFYGAGIKSWLVACLEHSGTILVHQRTKKNLRSATTRMFPKIGVPPNHPVK